MVKILRILHFNDVYHVASSSPDNGEPVGGAARFGHLMHSLQQTDTPTLTLFSGDAYFPSLESSISRGEHMLPILNKLDIDAATLGNHEFDQGIEVLESLIKRNNFPWVITNLTDSETGGPAARSSVEYLIKQMGDLKVGIIGVVEKEWLDTLPCLPPTFVYHDFVQSARQMAGKLKDEMECDLVVCLAHMRLPNDKKLADECQDLVDLVLSGHDHFYYLGSGIDQYEDPDGHLCGGGDSENDREMLEIWKQEREELESIGRRLIKSGTDFRDLNEITLQLTADKRVDRVAVKRHRITSQIPEEPEIKQIVTKIQQHLSKALDKVVGHTTVPWDARSTVCRTQESNLGNMSADLMRLCYAEGVGVQIGFLCGGAIRSDKVYGEGKILLRNIMEIFPFEDPVVVVRLTGDQIRRALENGVSKWPAQEGRFPQVSGIRFEFDPRRDPGDRITSIIVTEAALIAARMQPHDYSDEISQPPSGLSTPLPQSSSLALSTEQDESQIKGEPLDMKATYLVATRDYMYQGHDGYSALNEGELVVDEENGISFADLYRRFFHGLAVSNALRFQTHGYAENCSAARHRKLSPNSSTWKRLIIKHADDLRELAREQKQQPDDDDSEAASSIASVIQKYHEGLKQKAHEVFSRGSTVVRALLLGAKRLRQEQEPLRVARTALFGHEDCSNVPLPDTEDEDNPVPRNDDANGLLPGVLVNRKDTRTYASEGLLAQWAVVSPQIDGRIKIIADD